MHASLDARDHREVPTVRHTLHDAPGEQGVVTGVILGDQPLVGLVVVLVSARRAGVNDV